ncbi:Uncharacterised protein [Acidipropionibacterium jensenii]|uniref:Uncharacterized protein n=1 Tax=Acidipropionibacterium jensenii TaxID=1749 RepID=A0A3S4UZB3_9ACTN|nr:hypothetical protein [Acidipropionibacterium jensenii]VEI04121.1 Uncharacterised protein [Acidipropionibacterium jensenii]
MTTLEVFPVADDIDHTDGPDCICGPTITDATVLRWIPLAVSTAYLTWTLAAYIRTRRTR